MGSRFSLNGARRLVCCAAQHRVAPIPALDKHKNMGDSHAIRKKNDQSKIGKAMSPINHTQS
jgi:hypothetical protein